MFVKFKIHQGTDRGSYLLTHLIHVDNIGQVQPKYPANEKSFAQITPRDGTGAFCVEETVPQVEEMINQALPPTCKLWL